MSEGFSFDGGKIFLLKCLTKLLVVRIRDRKKKSKPKWKDVLKMTEEKILKEEQMS